MKPYKRLLVKISGEAFLGSLPFGIEQKATLHVASLLGELLNSGHEVAVVLGGGNIFRGVQKGSELNIARTPADHMGMLATFFNGIALKEALAGLGNQACLMSALECPAIAEKYHWEKAMEMLHEKRLLLFVGGIGHPFFTTDTTAALRASEINADLILKGTTRVDGIYDKDPLLHKDAKKYDHISYQKIVEQKLGIIDLTAAALCMSKKIPMRVFNMRAHSLLHAVQDSTCGTLVTGE